MPVVTTTTSHLLLTDTRLYVRSDVVKCFTLKIHGSSYFMLALEHRKASRRAGIGSLSSRVMTGDPGPEIDLCLCTQQQWYV